MTETEKQAFWILGRQASERLAKEIERRGIELSVCDTNSFSCLYSWFAGLMSCFAETSMPTEAEFARDVAALMQFSKPKSLES
jgi:hypothetical protein